MYYEASDFVETADNETLELIARTRELTREYYFSDYRDTEKRAAILQELLGGIGENVAIDTPFHCDHGNNIFLGNDVIIGINCTFVDNAEIHIGNKVMIASNVQFYTSSHPVLPQERLIPDWKEQQTPFFRTYARPIEVKDNAWIGGGSILLPGVTVGENSVIGAGSVVNRSIPANCVAAGNPCRVIRCLHDRLVTDLDLLHADLFLLVKVKAEQITLVPMEIFEVIRELFLPSCVVLIAMPDL